MSQLESKGRSIDSKALEEAATGIHCPGGFWGSQVASRGPVGFSKVGRWVPPGLIEGDDVADVLQQEVLTV